MLFFTPESASSSGVNLVEISGSRLAHRAFMRLDDANRGVDGQYS